MAATIGTEVISALIGRQILSQAISDASYSIYNNIQDIFYYSSDVDKVLRDLDVGAKIKMYEEMTKTIESNTKHNHSIMEMSLESIHDMIIKIREDLKRINSKIDKHKKKYLANWRSVNCKKELSDLVSHCNILDKRFNYLVKAIDIVKSESTKNLKN